MFDIFYFRSFGAFWSKSLLRLCRFPLALFYTRAGIADKLYRLKPRRNEGFCTNSSTRSRTIEIDYEDFIYLEMSPIVDHYRSNQNSLAGLSHCLNPALLAAFVLVVISFSIY